MSWVWAIVLTLLVAMPALNFLEKPRSLFEFVALIVLAGSIFLSWLEYASYSA